LNTPHFQCDFKNNFQQINKACRKIKRNLSGYGKERASKRGNKFEIIKEQNLSSNEIEVPTTPG